MRERLKRTLKRRKACYSHVLSTVQRINRLQGYPEREANLEGLHQLPVGCPLLTESKNDYERNSPLQVDSQADRDLIPRESAHYAQSRHHTGTLRFRSCLHVLRRHLDLILSEGKQATQLEHAMRSVQ